MKTVKEESWNYMNYIEKHPNFTGCVIDAMGDKAYYKNGILHREDDPAIEFVNGDKWYFLNNKRLSYREWSLKTKLKRIMNKLGEI